VVPCDKAIKVHVVDTAVQVTQVEVSVFGRPSWLEPYASGNMDFLRYEHPQAKLEPTLGQLVHVIEHPNVGACQLLRRSWVVYACSDARRPSICGLHQHCAWTWCMLLALMTSRLDRADVHAGTLKQAIESGFFVAFDGDANKYQPARLYEHTPRFAGRARVGPALRAVIDIAAFLEAAHDRCARVVLGGVEPAHVLLDPAGPHGAHAIIAQSPHAVRLDERYLLCRTDRASAPSGLCEPCSLVAAVPPALQCLLESSGTSVQSIQACLIRCVPALYCHLYCVTGTCLVEQLD
jgi:hypothetical protein